MNTLGIQLPVTSAQLDEVGVLERAVMRELTNALCRHRARIHRDLRADGAINFTISCPACKEVDTHE